ncbi:MAG TPA: DUF1259 domain-containing protein [Candidatus Polarisedimenticolia bacterium]|nr:DUF1259 domain-containing protein [Candidatus Polarisedimenticolia bacterium]
MRSHRFGTMMIVLLATMALASCGEAGAAALDAQAIGKAAGTKATVSDGAVRIGWTRSDVVVTVDGMPLPPSAGLGSWAAFQTTGQGDEAIVMGDTVLFQDEVDAAMDAALEHGLTVTALHNHFFFDEPRVFYMHLGGRGPAARLAGGVKEVWDAVRRVRAARPQPARRFSGPVPVAGGRLDAGRLESITGLKAKAQPGGVVKVGTGRTASMHGVEVGGALGLTSWAAFTGSDARAVIDGDLIMAANEVQPVLRALRRAGLHVVALHNHMIGEQPPLFFTHFWGMGPAADLAGDFKAALQAQARSDGEK